MDDFDAELLIAFRSGERWAFDACYSRHAPTLARYAWSRLGSSDLVEEALQETFLTAWKKRGRIVIVDESLLPWLMVVCRNHVSNLRRRAIRNRAGELLDEQLTVEPEFGAGTEWIDAEIRNLSPADQRVIQLCLVDNLTYQQAAEVVDSTAGAVGKRLERSRARLRRALTEEN